MPIDRFHGKRLRRTADLANVTGFPTAIKKKALEHRGRRPEPKLCDLVVTGLADSIS